MMFKYHPPSWVRAALASANTTADLFRPARVMVPSLLRFPASAATSLNDSVFTTGLIAAPWKSLRIVMYSGAGPGEVRGLLMTVIINLVTAPGLIASCVPRNPERAFLITRVKNSSHTHPQYFYFGSTDPKPPTPVQSGSKSAEDVAGDDDVSDGRRHVHAEFFDGSNFKKQ
ncbi:hypothetical protein EVAR_26858_1 [Eumeta japonica]|uniref:Uncharacterized protein n=1 Tax=Eumeta variegata TaxID=151549 RepID=A0A4C1VXW3_EUMVA|nr:hypothetical protein EVAR_26858_1 [Eumeta japonica]